MNGQITTAAQLSGYPLGAVFTDIEGGVWMIDSRNPATGACWMLSPETVRMSAKHVLRKWGPLGDQPTVAQAQAEALRQAARDWSDWDGLSAPEEWLARRADAIESGADRW